jgi:endonuclease/exonuclease/phosphatase family metal-dependent hydrolase
VQFDVARLVRSFDADIVVVPESYRDADGPGLLDALAGDGYCVESVEFMQLKLRRRNRDSERDAVPRQGAWELAIASRFPVLDRHTIPMGTVGYDPPGPRHALALTLDVRGTKVDVIGVHTSSKFWKLAPLKHLAALKRGLPVSGRPQILAGDFNFWGPPIAVMMRGWRRPVRGRTYPADRPHSQIDHVLVRNGVVGVSGEVLGQTPSDHRPIRARLRLDAGVT